mmetsp:Transcript_45635/g.111090  ORF Transcript_45635/g.111090 Transcript_45635/m.111090 type:complete len:316 (-) Transcript_45635:1737-2684(-)
MSSISRVCALARSSSFLWVIIILILDTSDLLARPSPCWAAAPCSSHRRCLSTTALSRAKMSSSSSLFSLAVVRLCAFITSTLLAFSFTRCWCMLVWYVSSFSREAFSCAVLSWSDPLMMLCNPLVTRSSCRSLVRWSSSSSSRSSRWLSHRSTWMPLRKSLISCRIETFSLPRVVMSLLLAWMTSFSTISASLKSVATADCSTSTCPCLIMKVMSRSEPAVSMRASSCCSSSSAALMLSSICCSVHCSLSSSDRTLSYVPCCSSTCWSCACASSSSSSARAITSSPSPGGTSSSPPRRLYVRSSSSAMSRTVADA